MIACGPGRLERTRIPDSRGRRPCLAEGRLAVSPGILAMSLLSQPLEEKGLRLQRALATLALGLTHPKHRTGYARLD